MEFASLAEERAHYTRHGLQLDAIEHRIHVNPGELLGYPTLMSPGSSGCCTGFSTPSVPHTSSGIPRGDTAVAGDRCFSRKATARS